MFPAIVTKSTSNRAQKSPTTSSILYSHELPQLLSSLPIIQSNLHGVNTKDVDQLLGSISYNTRLYVATIATINIQRIYRGYKTRCLVLKMKYHFQLLTKIAADISTLWVEEGTIQISLEIAMEFISHQKRREWIKEVVSNETESIMELLIKETILPLDKEIVVEIIQDAIKAFENLRQKPNNKPVPVARKPNILIDLINDLITEVIFSFRKSIVVEAIQEEVALYLLPIHSNWLQNKIITEVNLEMIHKIIEYDCAADMYSPQITLDIIDLVANELTLQFVIPLWEEDQFVYFLFNAIFEESTRPDVESISIDCLKEHDECIMIWRAVLDEVLDDIFHYVASGEVFYLKPDVSIVFPKPDESIVFPTQDVITSDQNEEAVNDLNDSTATSKIVPTTPTAPVVQDEKRNKPSFFNRFLRK